MRIGPRELFLLLLVVAIPIGSFFLAFKPQSERIAEDKASLRHMEEMLEQLRTQTARVSDLEQENEQIISQIESIESRLPTNKEIDAVVRQISELAVKSGLAPPTLRSNKSLGAASYREQPLAMSTTGPFGGFYGFFQQMERLPRIMRITDLKLQQDQDSDDIQAKFTLSIYYREGNGEVES